MAKPFSFKVLATDGKARRGVIDMPRGEIRTPAFMPVGTGGTVKAMYMDQVRGVGADIILGNTYHLMLRPGAERVARLGGLHEFARWPHPPGRPQRLHAAHVPRAPDAARPSRGDPLR